jgi:hypothetical protein
MPVQIFLAVSALAVFNLSSRWKDDKDYISENKTLNEYLSCGYIKH